MEASRNFEAFAFDVPLGACDTEMVAVILSLPLAGCLSLRQPSEATDCSAIIVAFFWSVGVGEECFMVGISAWEISLRP
jgi:hypothetical protein